MTSDDAISDAMRKLTMGDSLVCVIRATYLAGYREGDLDRQRMEAAVIRPKRKRSVPSQTASETLVGKGRDGDESLAKAKASPPVAPPSGTPGCEP